MNLCGIQLEPAEAPIRVPVNEGYAFRKETADFSAELFIDLINRRLKAGACQYGDSAAFGAYLERIATANGLTKILLTVREGQWQPLFLRGFELEAINPFFFQGQPGFHLSKFLDPERRIPRRLEAEDEILNQARHASRPEPKPLPPGYRIATAGPDQTAELAGLFASVFATYPTPLNDPSYLEPRIAGGAGYRIISHRQTIVSAATLEIDAATGSAELTDCATLPEYRGQGLISFLIQALEEDATRLGVQSVYTIARALSPGINKAFARLGYGYGGRFVNNCDICGQFEDMNLWSKRIERSGPL